MPKLPVILPLLFLVLKAVSPVLAVELKLILPSLTSADLTGIVYGADRFVAVGSAGTVLISADGLDWQVHSVEQTFRDVYYLNGRFLAYSNSVGLWQSVDGLSWEEVQPPHPYLHGISGGDGVFLIRHDSEIYRSLDLESWELVLERPNGLLGPVHNGESFWALRRNRHLLKSPDGIEWEEISHSSVYTIAGAVGDRVYLNSSAGPRWTVDGETLFDPGLREIPTIDRIFPVGNDRFFSTSSIHQQVFYTLSPEGAEYHPDPFAHYPEGGANIINSASNGEHNIAVGSRGLIMETDTGLDWRIVNASYIPDSTSSNGTLIRVNDVWLQVNLRQHFGQVSSDDGVSWKPVSLPGAVFRTSAVVSAGSFALLFVDYEFDDETTTVYRSSDGLSWEPTGSFESDSVFIETSGHGRVIINDGNDMLFITDDGYHWEPLGNPLVDDVGQIVLGRNSDYVIDRGNGFWRVPDIRSDEHAEYVEVALLGDLYPGEDWLLLNYGTEWGRVRPDGNQIETLDTVDDDMVRSFSAQGGFWRFRDTRYVEYSNDGQNWIVMQDRMHSGGWSAFYVSGDRLIFGERNFDTDSYTYWVSRSDTVHDFSVDWAEPFWFQRLESGDSVHVRFNVDLAVSEIERIEIWENGRKINHLSAGVDTWEWKLDSLGLYWLDVRVVSKDGRVRSTRNLQSILVQAPGENSTLTDVAPDSVRDIVRFDDLLFLAGGSDEEGSRYWVSKDGVDWQKRSVPSLTEVFGFVTGSDRIIAHARAQGQFAVSEDGSYWEQANQLTNSLHFDGEFFWMLDNAMWSIDGHYWNNTDLPRPLVSAASIGGSSFVSDHESVAWISDDLENWSSADIPGSYFRLSDHVLFAHGNASVVAWKTYDGVDWERIDSFDRLPSFSLDGFYVEAGFPLSYSNNLKDWYFLSAIFPDLDQQSLLGIVEFNGLFLLSDGNGLRVYGEPNMQFPMTGLSLSGPTEWKFSENREAVLSFEDGGNQVHSIYWKVNGRLVEGETDQEFRWQASGPGTYQVQAVWSPDGVNWFSTDSKTMIVSESIAVEMIPGPGLPGTMRDQLSANLYPLSDRLLMFYYNHTLISWNGEQWYYMMPFGPSRFEETTLAFADDFGAMIEDSSGAAWISLDYLFWVPAEYIFGTDNLNMIPSSGDIFAVRDYSGNQIRYVTSDSYEAVTLNVPISLNDLGFIRRYDDGRIMIHSRPGQYGSYDGGLNWFKLHEPIDLNANIRVSGQGGWVSARFGLTDSIIVSRDLWDWQMISVPSGSILLSHLFFDGLQYAVFSGGSQDPGRFLHVSEDGMNWRRVSEQLDINWPRLVQFGDTLFIQDTAPGGQLAYVGNPPREMSEQEIETRFHFLGFQGDASLRFDSKYIDFPAFTAVENGWIWSPTLGWVYPGGPGYPYFYFWSARHDGWLFVDSFDPEYWYSYREQTWGYLSGYYSGDPWLPMPRTLPLGN